MEYLEEQAPICFSRSGRRGPSRREAHAWRVAQVSRLLGSSAHPEENITH